MKKSMQTLHVSLVAAGLLLLLVPTSLAQRTVSDNGTADSRSLEQLRVERASLVKLRDLFRSGDYFPVQGVGGFSGWVKTEDAVNLALVSCLARKDPVCPRGSGVCCR